MRTSEGLVDQVQQGVTRTSVDEPVVFNRGPRNHSRPNMIIMLHQQRALLVPYAKLLLFSLFIDLLDVYHLFPTFRVIIFRFTKFCRIYSSLVRAHVFIIIYINLLCLSSAPINFCISIYKKSVFRNITRLWIIGVIEKNKVVTKISPSISLSSVEKELD